MIDYTIFYQRELPTNSDWSEGAGWDLLISAFNSSERVKFVFERVRAREKHWLVHEQYGYSPEEYPAASFVAANAADEAQYIQQYFDSTGLDIPSLRLCIDSTGFMRPHLMFLIRYLKALGVPKCDVLYTEPHQYSEKEATHFSKGPVTEIRQVSAFEGIHEPDTSKDVLIIGAGYDSELIAHVANHKNSARKIQMFGLPSLRPDMYQQNVLRARLAAEDIGGVMHDMPIEVFAPANNPFVTATVLSELVERRSRAGALTNLYLCPLGTKPQTIGFTLFYISECQQQPVSMIFPYARRYSQETSLGIARIWKYTIEFDAL